ncbi:MAG TPA: hypothetical protein VMH00_11715 [Candidatus Limnocylindrales bacterium]|nr:hypothetical protein [Candidatus Limnocylindrales bacterium]
MKQQYRTILKILAAGALAACAVISAIPSRIAADSLSTNVIGMFPKDVGEFAYADMKSARKLSWFPQLRDQILPSRFRQFEQFLASAGVDPNTQVDELAWGGITVGKTGGEEVVGVALGTFDPTSAEAHFKQQKLPSFDIKGYHLYSFGSGMAANDILFVFIDANTAAFGHRPALEKLIDVRTGNAESLFTNDKLYPLITSTNGNGFIWAVLNANYTHLAMTQLLPQANQFPQAATIINRMQAMTISVDADSGVDAKFQAVCSTADDANLLSAALQAGVMYRRYQEAQANPSLAAALDQVRVTPAGDRLNIEIPVSQDQLLSLIRTKVFSVQM